MATATGRPGGRPATVNKSLDNFNAIEPPEPLRTLKPYGKKIWARIWSEENSYLDPNKDIFYAQMICEAYQDIERMRAHLNKEKTDLLVINGGTNTVIHPYIKQINELQTKITSWTAAFAFSPVDRAKLNLEAAITENVNPFVLMAQKVAEARVND